MGESHPCIFIEPIVHAVEHANIPYRPVTANDALAHSCSSTCANLCGVHKHAHGWAWRSNVPARDANAFWGALGCSCFAF